MQTSESAEESPGPLAAAEEGLFPSFFAKAHLWLTEPEVFERGTFVRDLLIATVAFVYSVWAITGSGKDIIAKGFVLLLGGIPVYVLVKAWEKRHPVGEALEAPAGETVPAGGGRRRRLAPRRRMGAQH